MKNQFLLHWRTAFSFLLLIGATNMYAQTCATCPATQIMGDGYVVLLDGSMEGSPDYDQNAANMICIPAGTTYTGVLPQTGGGSVINICGTWAPTSNLTFQLNGNITFNNDGFVDMGGNNLFIGSNNTVFNNNGTVQNFTNFEVADAQFVNSGTVTGPNIYLHGRIDNTTTGTMTSTATCAGNSSTTCGFFIGDKNFPLVNDGAMEAVDFRSRKEVTGNGSVTASESLGLRGSYGTATTENTFSGTDLYFFEANNIQSGTFYTTNFNCDGDNFMASICSLDGSMLADISTCSGSSTNSSDCLILPVTLKSFSKVERKDYGLLLWESEEELNFSHYLVESSLDGSNWQEHSSYEGKGRGSVYQSEQIYFNTSTTYFRLKAIDLDGSMEIFDKIVYFNGLEGQNELVVYPNPVSNDQQLMISSPIDIPHIINVYDISGRKIHTQTLSTNGIYPIEFKDKLQKGTYIVELLSAQVNLNTKLIVQTD